MVLRAPVAIRTIASYANRSTGNGTYAISGELSWSTGLPRAYFGDHVHAVAGGQVDGLGVAGGVRAMSIPGSPTPITSTRLPLKTERSR